MRVKAHCIPVNGLRGGKIDQSISEYLDRGSTGLLEAATGYLNAVLDGQQYRVQQQQGGNLSPAS
jgi:hypothetical protein